MTGAELLVKALVKEGVEYVYGYPGVAICPFFDSLMSTEIHPILVREEQNAAHAASGYARITGKVGVCSVTSGPGATNLITGIATAFADSIPLVAITGQVDSRLLGSDVFQEADISGACESFVKFSYIVRKASDIPRIVKEAFFIASTGRKGPVLIDIPIDVQNQNISRVSWPEEVSLRTYKPTVRGNGLQIVRLMERLEKAKRPILCIGGGVHLAGAAQAVRIFAENNRIPTVCTMMGLGVMPTSHWMFFGMVGNNGQEYSNRAMNEADMVIMVGARVADRSVRPEIISEDKVLVHIDVDPAEIGKNAGPSIPLVGDLKSVFDALNEREPVTADHSEWIQTLTGYHREGRSLDVSKLAGGVKARDCDSVTPSAFVRALSLEMKENAVYVADVGQNQLWSCQNYVAREGRFLTSGGMGTMGYSIPAAIGAKMADPHRQVVAVCGDGAFQMSMMELATIRQYRVPVKICVMRNQVLGLVRQYQHFIYKDRFAMTTMDDTPNLEKLAEAYGIRYVRLERNEDIPKKIREFLNEEDTALLECIVDPNEVV
ncbi:MAG: biosynthetic-type acetolactate synthase large subunit [[Clostridium] aminophilum]|uniref:biosynthetic-type acetolactate synthase large subunit n=1 Tax=[Clostridium] aminophilum TaxID=1526 RepID=UPI0026F201A7|nr:biosynthetic-type acetolactate synthase large subunit [[Clostridium] aminophilum]MDD6197330.1 biosynthetic-type acetolactate synthase large subunit [[Clostridium] aminophilum]